jgi:hypothetical protein
MPSPPSGTFSEHRLVCFFSGPLPCYIIPLFDVQTHLRSKSIILISGFIFPQHHYMGGSFSFNCGLDEAGDRPYNQENQAGQNQASP